MLFEQMRGLKDSYDDMAFTPPLLATIAARTLIVHRYAHTRSLSAPRACPSRFARGRVVGQHVREFRCETFNPGDRT